MVVRFPGRFKVGEAAKPKILDCSSISSGLSAPTKPVLTTPDHGCCPGVNQHALLAGKDHNVVTRC